MLVPVFWIERSFQANEMSLVASLLGERALPLKIPFQATCLILTTALEELQQLGYQPVTVGRT